MHGLYTLKLFVLQFDSTLTEECGGQGSAFAEERVKMAMRPHPTDRSNMFTILSLKTSEAT